MRRVVVYFAVVALLAGAAGPVRAHAPAPLSGFEFPESVYWDGPAGSFYVANFGGTEFDPDGREPDGYLSKVGAEGRVRAAKWVTGLRSPKGMRRHGGELYVADVGQLVVIDVATAAISRTVDLDAVGAVLPNDVDVDPGTGDVYVTDTRRNAIYRLAAGALTPEVFVESPALESPNGLLVDGPNLVVAAFGAGGPGSGRVLLVDRATRATSSLAGMGPAGSLDGIERFEDGYLVTDHTGGRLLRVGPDGTVTEVRGELPGAADLGLRPGDRLAAVPQLREGKVRFVTVP